MPAKWHKYSYSAQRDERRSLLSIFGVFLLLGIVFFVIHVNLFAMIEIHTSVLEPTLSERDRIIATPLYNGSNKNTIIPLISPKRGDLAVISPAYPHELPLPLAVLDSAVAFLSLQRYHPFLSSDVQAEKSLVRRIVGLPGDAIYLDKGVLHIRPANAAHFLTEFELAESDYEVIIQNLPKTWTNDLPFSGSFTEITLSDSEYFVMNDNRSLYADSRIWGPISADRIQSKVLFRYWPFDRFGQP